MLLYGHKVLGAAAEGAQESALAVADTGIERYLERENEWPCGVGGGENPSLMVGMAGIGPLLPPLGSTAGAGGRYFPPNGTEPEDFPLRRNGPSDRTRIDN